MDRIPTCFFGVLGLVIGSFLNVCIYRLPIGESLVWPGSHCPACKRRLNALELVPVLGYLALRGRCRTCGFRIPARYPLVEILTGVAFYWAAATAEGPLDFLNCILFLSGLIVVFFVDLDHGIIPDVVILPLAVIGLVISGFQGAFPDRALAALIGLAVFWAIRFVGTVLLKEEAMGQGDIKLAVMMGSFLGIKLLATGLFLGFLIGGVIAGVLMGFGKRGARDPIPFGPMLAAGGALAMTGGTVIINWYSLLIARIWSL